MGENRVSPATLSIKDVVKIQVDSPFYESDEKQIQIRDYVLTRINSTAMDIQLDFTHPEELTLSAKEPDQLSIEFVHGDMFIGGDEFDQLDANLELEIYITP